MATAKPFTWTVRFTVAPIWIQDGFTISDERALSMLARTIGAGSADELQAVVLECPSPLQIVRMQGYGPKDDRGGPVLREIIAGASQTGHLRTAMLDPRQGEAVEIDA